MDKITHDSETLAKGQQVITACAFIHHNFDGVEKVFLPKRAETKKFLPGVYELPGGHIEFGEELVVGLKREINEEFHMDIHVGDSFFAFTYNNDIKKSHSIEVICFATFKDPIEKIALNPEDHSTFGWFGKDEILTQVINEQKTADDIEIQAILKGFALLENSKIDIG